jgi:hypothetical protein
MFVSCKSGLGCPPVLSSVPVSPTQPCLSVRFRTRVPPPSGFRFAEVQDSVQSRSPWFAIRQKSRLPRWLRPADRTKSETQSCPPWPKTTKRRMLLCAAGKNVFGRRKHVCGGPHARKYLRRLREEDALVHKRASCSRAAVRERRRNSACTQTPGRFASRCGVCRAAPHRVRRRSRPGRGAVLGRS